jgi:replicative DNA helicase
MANQEVRTIPHNAEAERAVLGCMLLDREACQKSIDKCKGDYFYSGNNLYLYNTIVNVFNSGKVVDMITMTHKLQADGKLDDIGGVSGLTKLIGDTVTTANIDYYMDILRDCYNRRRLISKCIESIDNAYRVDNDGYLEKSEDVIYEVINEAKVGSGALITDDPISLAKEVGDELADHWAGGGGYLRTGVQEFDSQYRGFENGKLIVLSALGGVGKSSFLQQVSMNLATRGDAVAYCCLDTDKKEVVKRIVCNLASITWDQLHSSDNLVIQPRMTQVSEALDKFRRMPIYLIGQQDAGDSVDALCSWAIKAKKEKNIKVIFVDSASKLVESRQKNENSEDAVSRVINKLTKLSIRTGVPVIAIVELTKGEGSAQSRLKGSHSWHYQARTHIEPTEENGVVKLSVLKNNNGQFGDVFVSVDKKYYRFGARKRVD